MSSRDPHGDDWIEILGGLLVTVVVLAWNLVVLIVQLIQWLVQRRRR